MASWRPLILSGLEPGENVIPGEIRWDSRVVGRYLCAPATDCGYLLEQFCAWMNGSTFQPKDGDEIVYGIIKAIVAHIYFVWIHPFGDGNGRTARLLELKFLMEAGVPSDAAHLLSNHYNLTRHEYYLRLDAASKSGGELLPFIEYAVGGFVKQLREQIAVIRGQQLTVTWINHVHDRFKSDKFHAGRRQRALTLAISAGKRPIQKNEVVRLTPELAVEYANKTSKTVSRDLNTLVEMKLLRRQPAGYVPAQEEILAFLPVRRRSAVSEVTDWDEPLGGDPEEVLDDDLLDAEVSDEGNQLALL
jgi:Fic family protein